MLTIPGCLVVIGAGAILASCGGSGTENSQKIVNDIKVNGSTKLIVGSGASSDIASMFTATIGDTTCAQSGATQTYSCVVHFTVGDSVILQKSAFTANISGTCDDAGACKWHVTNVVAA
jgi:hypothetical protein